MCEDNSCKYYDLGLARAAVFAFTDARWNVCSSKSDKSVGHYVSVVRLGNNLMAMTTQAVVSDRRAAVRNSPTLRHADVSFENCVNKIWKYKRFSKRLRPSIPTFTFWKSQFSSTSPLHKHKIWTIKVITHDIQNVCVLHPSKPIFRLWKLPSSFTSAPELGAVFFLHKVRTPLKIDSMWVGWENTARPAPETLTLTLTLILFQHRRANNRKFYVETIHFAGA